MAATPDSEAQRIAQLDHAALCTWFAALDPSDLGRISHDWTFWARGDQHPPKGEWRTWFVMAGRGFGKTRMAAEYVRSAAEADGRLRIALVAATLHEARSVMVEGESGLLAIASAEQRPTWEPSLKRLAWPNGAIAKIYGASEPEALRGPEHHLAWADEIAKWEKGVGAWDNLMMTMRLGEDLPIDEPQLQFLVSIEVTGIFSNEYQVDGEQLEITASIVSGWQLPAGTLLHCAVRQVGAGAISPPCIGQFVL